MDATDGFYVRRLAPADIELMHALNRMFGEAFGDIATYTAKPPRGAYLDRLLGNPEFVALVAMERGEVHAVSAICTHLGCIVSWNSPPLS